MIIAEAQPLDLFHLRLVFTGPDGFKKEPVTVADKSEAIRLVYFYNRLYVADTLKGWLRERYNVFMHINDFARADMANELTSLIDRFSKASLHQVCQLVIDQQRNLNYIAPRETSRYYKKYAELIIPITLFCQEMKGVPQAC
ncbi:hypothetical protein [Mucilaginibacter sp.]|uniref:hypothetical protein n=1 Tax=Mucilaginibacter sp. TaxID=1882438 RepID=UPI00262A6D36|nr:hypothetical protein [Mucilaginibacter sp.]MDB4919473.1 hypothetical protein [Mucilaginibacter sp.]